MALQAELSAADSCETRASSVFLVLNLISIVIIIITTITIMTIISIISIITTIITITIITQGQHGLLQLPDLRCRKALSILWQRALVSKALAQVTFNTLITSYLNGSAAAVTHRHAWNMHI